MPRGTTAVVADPHEITNVLGTAGCEYISKASESVPLDVMLSLPSCVPATPFETSGAKLDGKAVEKHINDGYIFGLGELMNYVGVINCDADVLKRRKLLLRSGK